MTGWIRSTATRGWVRTSVTLVAATLAIFAVSLLMNGDHLGVNAAIHWDARTEVCSADPMPDRAALLAARGHVFDPARGSDVPAVATYYFNSGTDRSSHWPLEIVRRYYAQVSTELSRGMYRIGARWTGSPTGGIVVWQLSAAIAVAVGLGIVVTVGIAAGPVRILVPRLRENRRSLVGVGVISDTENRLEPEGTGTPPRSAGGSPVPSIAMHGQDARATKGRPDPIETAVVPSRHTARGDRVTASCLLALFLAAVVGEPVMLSLSRQMLTEPAGFLFLAAAWGTVAWFYRPGTSTFARIVLSVLGAGFFFLTLRTRYSLAVTALAVTPLVILLVVSPTDLRRRWWSYLGGIAVAGITVGVLVAIDVRRYGPFIYPWEYQKLLVKSTRLFFHTKPPFDPFWTALYVNGPLLALPVLVIGCGWVGRVLPHWQRANRQPAGRRDLVLLFASIALVGLAYPLAKAGAQQVGYQPRHLFPFSAGFVAVALLIFPWIRWRWFTAVPFGAICGVVIAANIYSTVGPQRTTMAEEFPPVFTTIMRKRGTEPNPPPMWKDLLASYYDWADNRRLHDSLVVLRYAREHPSANGHKSLLIVDENTEGGWWIRQTAVEFQQPVGYWRGDAPAVQEATTVQITNALTAGDRVLVACCKGSIPKELPFHTRRATLPLDVTDLREVVADNPPPGAKEN